MKLKLKVAMMTAADPRDLVEVKAKRHHFTGAGSLSLSQALRSTSFHLWTFLVVESAITEINRETVHSSELRRAQIKLQSHICCHGITLFSGFQRLVPRVFLFWIKRRPWGRDLELVLWKFVVGKILIVILR